MSDCRPALTDTEHQRRCRDRRRRGVILAMVEVSPAVLCDFIDRAWISEEDACDSDKPCPA